MEEREIIASVLQEVLDALPPPLREKLENVAFVVRDEAERGWGLSLDSTREFHFPKEVWGTPLCSRTELSST